ncbi:putative membrane-anchored protein [Arthrobacter sp. CAN_A2]|uniref:COG4705 family protein n=1 Tax=Arthrobacter sp. CAN_A2 TaxID=2787718 RepID=UPI001A2C709A
MNQPPISPAVPPSARRMLSKVPEITLWFWIIKILCTTVGESFADYINMALGVGLVATAVIFTVVSAVVLAVQMKLTRYRPGAYWLTVVIMSITGTLYTDILTDQAGVPLGLSATVFSAVLAIVFAIWFVKERTLSIHSIVSVPREAFYWLAVLVTFALGTALGDWTLELTGWGPGLSILLPLALIGVVTALWRFGANPVLTFWVAYILTRPLGANIGDWLGLTPAEGGIGLGTFATSVLFLAAILATVVYLTLSKADVVERPRTGTAQTATPARERAALGLLGAVAVATVGLLAYTNSIPHASALADEGSAPTCTAGSTPLTQDEARAAARTSFPATDLAEFRAITTDTLDLVTSGDQAGAAGRATDLETAWDNSQDALFAADCQAWTFIDGQIDPVLSSVRAGTPDPAAEQEALQTLLTTLGDAGP